MAELLQISQSSILAPRLRSNTSFLRRQARSLGTRSALCSSFPAITIHRPHYRLPRFPLTRVVSDSVEPTTVLESSGKKEIEFQPNSSGGDGLGGGGRGEGGGGGGGRGDDSGSGAEEGGSEENENKEKSGMSMSQKLTLGYAALVGVGGLMGYLKGGSQKSLLSGGISALLLFYVYTQLPTKPAFASAIGLGLSAALLVVMGSRFKKSGKVFPAGVVSLVSLIMSGGYLHGIMRSLH